MIRLNQVSGGYESHIDKIHDVSLHVEKGFFFTLIGPNGSGKSTLLHMISGALPVRSGEVYLHGRLLNTYSALQRASFLTVLSQEHEVTFDFSVQEIVMLGRYPHQKGWLKTVTTEDEKVVEEAMRTAKVLKFCDHPFRSLSGGEKQRVLLAKSLAQEPEVLLLDEPTNHLDIRHMHDMLHLIKTWQQTRALTVLAVLHDLNIASLYSDRIGLLHEGRLVKEGGPSILHNNQLLERIYGIQTLAQDHPLLPKPQLFLSPPPDPEESNSMSSFHKTFLFQQDERSIQIVFDKPLRTFSNVMHGEGLRWIRYFYLFYDDQNNQCSNRNMELRKRLGELDIPFEQAAGMMSLGYQLNDHEWVVNHEGDHSLAVLVAANLYGTINTFVFMDGYLTDGALVNAIMCATEAKVKALQDANVLTVETTSDQLLVASTQRGQESLHPRLDPVLGKLIGQTVYQATCSALGKAVQSHK